MYECEHRKKFKNFKPNVLRTGEMVWLLRVLGVYTWTYDLLLNTHIESQR